MAARRDKRTESDVRAPFIVADSGKEIYRDGRYLEHNPSWHMEESPFKVRQILRMLKRQDLMPKTICDVGCGAGLVLSQLQPHLAKDCVCWGFDVAPGAIAMCRDRCNDNLTFSVLDVRRDGCNAFFDLVLMLDVFEHVEDYMGLVRDVKPWLGTNFSIFRWIYPCRRPFERTGSSRVETTSRISTTSQKRPRFGR